MNDSTRHSVVFLVGTSAHCNVLETGLFLFMYPQPAIEHLLPTAIKTALIVSNKQNYTDFNFSSQRTALWSPFIFMKVQLPSTTLSWAIIKMMGLYNVVLWELKSWAMSKITAQNRANFVPNLWKMQGT